MADAPGSSGLGSSSTFCVGLLNALYSYKGENVSRGQLAEEAAHIEVDVLKRPMGKQDHYAAAFGGINYIIFNDDESASVMPISKKYKYFENLFSNMLTFWTGIARSSEDILEEQDKNNNKNSDVLLKMRDQALEMYKLAKKEELDVETFGAMLNEGWIMKCTLATKINNSLIAEAYKTAIANGALGGKISGAGGGGFLNLFVFDNNIDTVISAMEKFGLKYFPVGLDTYGTSVSNIT